MNIPIGCDHAGYELKDKIKTHFEAKGFSFDDKGTNGPDSVDYPDYAHAVASAVEDGASWGILICGSANGVNMVANKYPNVRSAMAWQVELATLARTHNDANVVALPARFIDLILAKQIVEAFLTTEFEGGRHAKRRDKIACS